MKRESKWTEVILHASQHVTQTRTVISEKNVYVIVAVDALVSAEV